MRHLCAIITAITTLGLLVGCDRQPELFAVDVLNAYTPVKSQGRSQTCWAYAMLAAIETEHIMRGDSVNLSAPYVEHCLAQEPDAPSSHRGMATTLLYMIGRHGLVPWQAMPTTDDIAPNRVFMLGAEYTPLEFSHSVCAPGEYVALTSTSQQPYYTSFVIDTPDNWARDSFLNVPPDTLVATTRRAVASGHGVCWEGDTSEPGYDWKRGVARLSAVSRLTNTTDDHCMAIVGLAHDDSHQPYFILKNSWGTDNARQGLLYMHEDYFRAKTIAVVMTREAAGMKK